MKYLRSLLCISLALLITFSSVSCSEKEKSRLEMTPDERLWAALDDLYVGGNYDIFIDIKHDIRDGDSNIEIQTEILKNTDENGTVARIKRLTGDYPDEYYIDNAYYKPDGTLAHPNCPLELKGETLFADLTPEFVGEYIFVDGEKFKTYEFTVPKNVIEKFITEGSSMKASEAKGSIVLTLDGYLSAIKIKAVTENWIKENMFYEYDSYINITVNAINEKTEKVVLPFEYKK